MKDKLRFPVLEEIGFSLNEARIYELLLVDGIQKVQDLAKKSGISRGNVYNTLTQLKAKGFVLPIEGKVERFQAADPARLSIMVDSRKEAAQALEGRFRTELQNLTSAFTLSTGKPAIQIFEGLEGVERVLEDTLSASGEILTLVDPDAITDAVAKVETRYIKKRIERQIRKRVLLPDTQTAHTTRSADDALTTTRIASGLSGGFGAAVEIYDDRFSLITLTGNRIISVIIENSSLAALQRAQFEALWASSAKPSQTLT
jgi:sugar-specific transcriptional regulator TrmB